VRTYPDLLIRELLRVLTWRRLRHIQDVSHPHRLEAVGLRGGYIHGLQGGRGGNSIRLMPQDLLAWSYEGGADRWLHPWAAGGRGGNSIRLMPQDLAWS
jgi:hypothetical protein